MKHFVLASLSLLALSACTVPQNEAAAVRLDPTGTHYEAVEPSQPVNDSMRNSTVNPSSDRMSGRYPVGSTPDSNAH